MQIGKIGTKRNTQRGADAREVTFAGDNVGQREGLRPYRLAKRISFCFLLFSFVFTKRWKKWIEKSSSLGCGLGNCDHDTGAWWMDPCIHSSLQYNASLLWHACLELDFRRFTCKCVPFQGIVL